MPRQKFVIKPAGIVAEQGLAPELVGQQVGVEDQQGGAFGAGGILPGQLALGNGRDIRQGGVALMLVDEVPHIFPHHQPAEARVQLRRQPALAAGFGAR